MSELKSIRPEAGPAPEAKLHDVAEILSRFISTHQYSALHAMRWLATEVFPPLLERLQAQSGRGRVSEEDVAAIRAFRIAEAEKALDKKREDVEAAERELETMRSVKP